MSNAAIRGRASDLQDALVVAAHGHAIFQIAAALAQLGVPDLIGDGTKTADELAQETGADPGSLFRLLRAAAAIGLLVMCDSGKFELTELGSMFRAGSSTGAAAAVAMSSVGPVWQAWGGLAQAVRTGRPAFDCAHRAGIFEYLEQHPELATVFHAAMALGTKSLIPHLVRHYDFGEAEYIADIGGGNGTHLAAILDLDKRFHGVIFDTASGLRGSAEVLRRAGVADRCEAVIGDFFRAVPSEADVYILKNVLTDWDDESCVRILRNCRAAMAHGGKVVIVATLMPQDISSQGSSDMLAASIFDVSLMVMTTGRERTLPEYERLLARAGLSMGKVAQITRKSANHTILYHTIEAQMSSR